MANKKGPVIGLTGQTGAGKSTAAALLRAQGLAVIDADEIARKVTRPGSFVLSALAAAFGADLILPDGSLNRPLLAQRAFSSPWADGAAQRNHTPRDHPTNARRNGMRFSERSKSRGAGCASAL